MIALIDGDIVLYRTGFSSNEETLNIAKARMRSTMETLLETVNAERYLVFLTDSRSNFRKALFPAYKANRDHQEKPRHHEELKEYLIKKYDAMISEDQEADDDLGIMQTSYNSRGWNSVICSIDKDLLQIPGWHYNWVKDERKYVGIPEARYRFWKQVLVGDGTDNITPAQGLSCPGIGEVKAYEALEGESTEEEYFKQVYRLYLRACDGEYTKESIQNRLTLTAQLVKIRTKEGEMWTPPLSFSDVGL